MKKIFTVFSILVVFTCLYTAHSMEIPEDSLDVVEKVYDNIQINEDISLKMNDLASSILEIYAVDDEVLIFGANGILSFDINTRKLDSVFAVSYREYLDSSLSIKSISYRDAIKKQDTFGMVQKKSYKDTSTYSFLMSFDKTRNWDTLYKGSVRFKDFYDKSNFVGYKPGSDSLCVYKSYNGFETINKFDVLTQTNLNFIKEEDVYDIGGVHFGSVRKNIFCHIITIDKKDEYSVNKYQCYLIYSLDGGVSWKRIDYPEDYLPNDYDIRVTDGKIFIPGKQYFNTETYRNGYLKIMQFDEKQDTLKTIYVDEDNYIPVGYFYVLDDLWLIPGTKKLFYSIDGGESFYEATNEAFKHGFNNILAIKDTNEFYFVSFTSIYRAVIDVPSSVNNVLQDNIKLYPNPASDHLNVDTDIKNFKYEIYNISGNIVKSGYASNNSIDIEKLNTGTYFLVIDNKTYKFIKSER